MQNTSHAVNEQLFLKFQNTHSRLSNYVTLLSNSPYTLMLYNNALEHSGDKIACIVIKCFVYTYHKSFGRYFRLKILAGKALSRIRVISMFISLSLSRVSPAALLLWTHTFAWYIRTIWLMSSTQLPRTHTHTLFLWCILALCTAYMFICNFTHPANKGIIRNCTWITLCNRIHGLHYVTVYMDYIVVWGYILILQWITPIKICCTF